MKLASIIVGIALFGAALLSEVAEAQVVGHIGRGGGDHRYENPCNPGVDPSPYDPPCTPGDYRNPGQPGPGYGQQIRRDMYIGGYLRDQVINLNQLIPFLGPRQIARVDFIEVNLNDSGRGSLTLMVDGFRQDTVYSPQPFTTIYPQTPVVIRSQSQSLGLQVGGKMYIDRITVSFTLMEQGGGYPPPPPPPGGGGYGEFTIDRFINQNYSNFSSINISQIANLYQYRGYRVLGLDVRLRANSSGRILRLTLMSDGRQEDDQQQYPDNYTRVVHMMMRSAGVIGRDVNELVMLLDGSAYVEQVSVRLSR